MSSFNGSRFANPNRTAEISVGPCRCPEKDGVKPHERDGGVARRILGGSALARIGLAALDRVAERDPLRGHRQTILEALVSWNLLGPEGQEWPITPETVELLDEETTRAFARQIDEANENGPLPNASGGRSPGSRRATASPTRKRKKRKTPTRS